MQEPADSKRIQIIKLKEIGLSCAEIGRRLGISRQRVSQIIRTEFIRRPDFHTQAIMMARIRKEKLRNVGKVIKQQRSRSGLTLRQLGEISGVSMSHLSCIERGNHLPSARILQQIAKSLCLSEAELFVLVDYAIPQK